MTLSERIDLEGDSRFGGFVYRAGCLFGYMGAVFRFGYGVGPRVS